ncbi:MAG: SH3 domain-containing protein [Chitinophagaceae bacterium]|nr:SH3 domain-containing protein [Oligoflexus sp.]
MKFSILAPLSLTFLLFSSVAIAAQVSAKKDGTQVFSEPKKGAAVVRELKKGETIDAGDRAGMFWKVKTAEGKEGFVSVMAVQREAGQDSGIQTALHDAAMKARNSPEGGDSARARSAVMGVRGLNENNELAEIGSLKPDLRAIYHMEDRALNVKRVDRLESLVQKEVENTATAQNK